MSEREDKPCSEWRGEGMVGERKGEERRGDEKGSTI